MGLPRERGDDMTEHGETAIATTEGAGPIVAALGYDVSSPVLVRAAGALAREAGVGLECVTVDTGELPTPEEGERLAEAQRLARSLGGRVEGEPNLDAVDGVLEYARRRGARAIVAGDSGRGPFSRRFANRLRAEGRDLRIIAISSPRTGGRAARAGALLPGPASGYLAAFCIIAAVTFVNLFLAGYAGYWAAAIPYMAAISLSALALESGPVLFAAILSALAWDLLFIPPRFVLHISKPEDVFMLGLYLVIAVGSGLMTGRLRASRELLAAREVRMSAISALASALAGAKTIEKILETGVEAIKEALGVEALVILREAGGGLKKQAASGWEPLDESAREAARIAFETNWGAGRFTDIRPDSEWHFLPMEGPRGCLGVIGIRASRDKSWNEGLEAFLRTMVATVSIAAARELTD
jgi:two-component system, OmpR family, sensor histidine kinase KdpD